MILSHLCVHAIECSAVERMRALVNSPVVVKRYFAESVICFKHKNCNWHSGLHDLNLCTYPVCHVIGLSRSNVSKKSGWPLGISYPVHTCACRNQFSNISSNVPWSQIIVCIYALAVINVFMHIASLWGDKQSRPFRHNVNARPLHGRSAAFKHCELICMQMITLAYACACGAEN